jgi:hypothetical protein
MEWPKCFVLQNSHTLLVTGDRRYMNTIQHFSNHDAAHLTI